MATVCELSAAFEDSVPTLFRMFEDNVQAAGRWGHRWDVVRDETLTTADGAVVRQLWGFTTAYARVDGMGGHLTFLMKFIDYDGATELNVVVTSPYEKYGQHSAYYKRSHLVALRLLEFCVAPYDEIHPRLRVFTRLLGGGYRASNAT